MLFLRVKACGLLLTTECCFGILIITKYYFAKGDIYEKYNKDTQYHSLLCSFHQR